MTIPRLTRNFAGERDTHAQLLKAGWPDWNPMPLVYVTAGHEFVALVGSERCGGPKSALRWHISLRGPGRVPTWDELVDAAHQLQPGVMFVVAVPPRSLWMNMDPNVLHLWETNDRALLEEMHVYAKADQPS